MRKLLFIVLAFTACLLFPEGGDGVRIRQQAPVSNIRRDEAGEGIRRRVFGTFCGQKVQSIPQAKLAVDRRPKSGGNPNGQRSRRPV